METERHEPRACLRPTHGPTRPVLERAGTTRDTPAEQLRKRERIQSRMWYLYSPKLIICGEELSIQQAHIKNARNWMAAAGHAIEEVVSLHRCECGENSEQWGSRPTPPCLTCEKTRLRKTAPDEKGIEMTERAGKRTK